MCVEVWNIFQQCNHKLYQNTYLCHVAKRRPPNADNTMIETKFLPDREPKIPPGMFGCKLREATRPKSTPCPECARLARLAQGAARASKTTASSLSTESGRSLTSPSPDASAVKQMRDSLIFLEQHRKVT
ncbi:uncharacterized protein GGS25DRAFT_519696 [Hypoxylon fragiforme]|uniref:uncharacterized protein n=1 Tax=Hypoxylon fragiforme TaxID=63214 RepID=UPI0020C70FA5|nr:uncharacterized protein GGS25DRAFT_519696 [Hypoxylon fragiforme]KAI2611389.1 hypothetical protein GGS25DRAFT_519696 [Hypoxylon fragiforme]